jgi:hypothetical protein
MALVTLAALACGIWASGCNGLSGDCELNLTCPTATTTTTTMMPKCSGFLPAGSCDTCVQGACCQELQDCALDNTCLNGCLFNVWPSPDECNAGKTKMLLDAFAACMAKSCPTDCRATDQCNPVTNNGCETAKEVACDAGWPGEFVCLPPYGTPAQLCETCDNIFGPYCGPGLRCHEGSHKCARYCCTDADCGSGTCVTDPAVVFTKPLAVMGDNVGLCLDAGKTMPACDAPMMAASMGSCVAGYPGM